MKIAASVVLLFCASAFAYGEGPKACEDLKSEIQKKLEDHGSKNFTLDILDKDKEAEGKVVGTCGGGTKKIVYTKPEAPAATTKAPAATKTPAAAKKP
jgi:hypothetical protein